MGFDKYSTYAGTLSSFFIDMILPPGSVSCQADSNE